MSRSKKPSRRELLRRGFGLSITGLGLSGLGCGYSIRPPSYPDIRTVYVPVFRSLTFRRDVNFMITQLTIQEVEERTKFKVVGSPEGADTILEGTINFAEKNIVVENPFNLARELNAWMLATVRWIHNPPLEQEKDAAPVVISELINFIPEVGETSQTAFYRTCQNLATQIVDMMDAPW
jgi:hypothetical protein